MKKNSQKFLKQEREDTDESLNCERGKTDESLHLLRKRTEKQTDDQVKNDRREADQTRAQSRSDSDSLATHSANEVQRVQELRQSVDEGVKFERRSMDQAIQRERAVKEQLFNTSLHRERDETDDRLLHERSEADTEVDRAAKLLTEECNSHLFTKAELTTRDEFLAIVSHDLRNPIGAVLSCAELLMDDPTYKAFSGEVKSWIEMMKRNAESSLRMISDILDLERVVGGKLQLQRRQEDIISLIHEIVESHAHMAAAKQIHLGTDLANEKFFVNCDRDRIVQVLSNLIGNAIKFTPEGGSVVISASQSKNELQVKVTDTGPGIPTDQLKRIFERYAQLQNKDRRGLGLGLYISKMLVEAHQGKLWVTSTYGQGSAFHFTLPKIQNPQI